MPIIIGTENGETLTGGPGDDQIEGRGGNDVLVGAGGNDTTDGGNGNDQHFVDSAGDIVIERPGEGDDEVITGVSYGLGDGTWVETLRTDNAVSTLALSLLGNEIPNSIYGNAGNNVLNGGGGNDYLVGLEGNDYLIGGGGTDAMLGGTGNDTYTIDLAVGDHVSIQEGFLFVSATVVDIGDGQTITVSQPTSGGGSTTRTVQIGQVFSGDNVLESPGEGEDVVVASTSYILRSGVSVELLAAAAGSAGVTLRGNELANSIYGNDGNNILSGGPGDDYIVGGAGNDTLDGESGNDIMAGGTGNDTYTVTQAGDRVIETAGQGFDRIDTGISYTISQGVEVEVLAATPSTSGIALLAGNEFVQTIVGNDFGNRLSGGGGADTLNGQGGNDVYDISDGGETIVEGASGGTDTAYVSTNYTLNAGAQVETLSTYWQYGSGGYDITGNAFAQTIIGDFGSNMLDGKGGSDTLVGLGGADTFAFTTALGAGNVDLVADFSHGTDKIALDDAVFSGIGGLGALNANAFVVGTAAGDADDRIIYDAATGNLYFDADGNGAGAQILFANIGVGTALLASDFQVI